MTYLECFLGVFLCAFAPLRELSFLLYYLKLTHY